MIRCPWRTSNRRGASWRDPHRPILLALLALVPIIPGVCADPRHGVACETGAGSSGDRFPIEMSWWLAEGGTGGGLGWTIDDVYFHWSERHPKDQADSDVNDCASIPSRPGANPAARQCGTVAWERLTTHNCTTGIQVTVSDSTPAALPAGVCAASRCTAGLPSRIGISCTSNADCTCAAGEVFIAARSTTEPLGENVCLQPKGGNLFGGIVRISALVNQAGVLNVNATQGENFNIVASYADPECDQDGDGALGENSFRDVDGDGVPNFGADNIFGDISATDLLAGGQGSSDDDNCYDPYSLTDVFNPPGIPQRDNDGDGAVTAADCPPAGQPNGRSPRNGQCDWDDDGRGDLCDNCPLTANNDQLDSDGDGVGSVCDSSDIDGDGVANAQDNCPTLYNPTQQANPGNSRGLPCDGVNDGDGDGVIEYFDNCPNETGFATCDPTPCIPWYVTYNPDQADNDADGIGDRCDTEDLDGDLVPNDADNCPTLYNPADPVFGFQTDSDQDGRGDDRRGIDTLAGPQNYCDPDSADDDRDGIPDDLIQFASELNCEHSRSGDTNMASTPVSVGSITIAALSLADDGTADFNCTAGDPNPSNSPALPEPCPQENPASPDNDAFCDTPGSPGSGRCAAVPDGTADPGELAALRLTLTNASVDKLAVPIPLLNLAVGVRPTTPSVGCVPRSQVFMGTMAAGATVQTPVLTGVCGAGGTCTAPFSAVGAACSNNAGCDRGAIAFIVDPANPGPGRSTAARFAQAELALTAAADGIEGIPEQKFRFTVDMDRTDAAPIAANCPGTPGSPPGTLCEDFDTNRNASPGIQFSRLAIGVDPNDPLRAVGDPNDDVLGYTMHTGPSPGGTDGRICSDDNQGFIGCQGAVAEEDDWHVHSPFEIPGTPYDTRPGSGAPDGGKARSGVRSLHMGRHLDPSTTLQDTIRFRQVSAFVLDSQGDPGVPGVIFGTGSTLEFWHMISVPDDENFGNGFLGPGGSFGGGQVQMSLLGPGGLFEKWQVLTPSFNGYDSVNNETISLCNFDPGDDQIPPGNETMCNNSPLWADMGDIFGTDATCQIDTDNNDPTHKDCGARACTPGPGCTENGATGVGVWARSAFNLSPFVGRVARLRWIGTMNGGWSFGTQRSALESDTGGIGYQYYDGDDGWYIDDIRLTDLRQFPSTPGPDIQLVGPGAGQPSAGLWSCTTGQTPANCGIVTLIITGSSAFGARRMLGLDTLGQPVRLDARGSAAGDDPDTAGLIEGACDNGVLEFQWSELDVGTLSVVEVISPFSPRGDVRVAPARDSLYRVQARCSSDLACAGSQDVVVKVYTGDGSDLNPQAALNTAGVSNETGLTVTGGPTATLSWPARTQPPGISGYDVFRFRSVGTATGVDVFSGNTFDGTCFANAVPNATLGNLVATTDATPVCTSPGVPSGCLEAGSTFMYQVGHSSNAAAAIAPLGVRPPSSSRAGQLVTAGATCP